MHGGHSVCKGNRGPTTTLNQPQTIAQDLLFGKMTLKVVSGANHALVLAENKAIIIAGDGCKFLKTANSVGIDRKGSLLIDIVPLNNVEDVFTGPHHCFALTKLKKNDSMITPSKDHNETNRVLYAWGLNDTNQLGLNQYQADRLVRLPKVVDTLDTKNIETVTAGQHHTLFLMKDGRVFGVGLNEDGQLGPASEMGDSNVYYQPTELRFTRPVAWMMSSNHFNYAWLNDGSLVSWGLGCSYVLANHVESVAPSPFHISPDYLLNLAGSIALGGSHVVFAEGVNPLENNRKLDRKMVAGLKTTTKNRRSCPETAESASQKQESRFFSPCRSTQVVRLMLNKRSATVSSEDRLFGLETNLKRTSLDSDETLYKPTKKIKRLMGDTSKISSLITVNN